MDLKELESEFRHLQGCCLHEPVWTPVDVAAVLCSVWSDHAGEWEDTPKKATESQSYTVVRLKDGRLGLLEESEDYTGHGCQCGAATAIYNDLPTLLNLGVPDDDACAAISQRLSS